MYLELEEFGHVEVAFYPSLSNFLKEFRSDSPVERHQFSDEPHIKIS